jgi:hypothetical protein
LNFTQENFLRAGQYVPCELSRLGAVLLSLMQELLFLAYDITLLRLEQLGVKVHHEERHEIAIHGESGWRRDGITKRQRAMIRKQNETFRDAHLRW